MSEQKFKIVSLEGSENCPWCDTKFTGAAGATTTKAPNPGDLGLCVNCGEMLLVLEGNKIRRLTYQEFKSLEPKFRDMILQKSILIKTDLFIRL